MPTLLAFIQNIGPFQWLILLAVGLLIFGKRLPEIGRSLGKSIVEFKKGLHEIEHDIDHATKESSAPPVLPDPTPADSRTVSTTDSVEEQPKVS